jgi:DNA-binding MarR family transcriptional regulator
MTRPIKTAPRKNLSARARLVKDACFARAARSVARKVISAYEAHLAPHDLSIAQFMLLLTIAGARDNSLAAIADEADIDPSTLTRNLQGLERIALVEVTASEEDLRKRSVWLTATGTRRLEAAIPSWETAQLEIEGQLGPSFLPTLLRAEKAL